MRAPLSVDFWGVALRKLSPLGRRHPNLSPDLPNPSGESIDQGCMTLHGRQQTIDLEDVSSSPVLSILKDCPWETGLK